MRPRRRRSADGLDGSALLPKPPPPQSVSRAVEGPRDFPQGPSTIGQPLYLFLAAAAARSRSSPPEPAAPSPRNSSSALLTSSGCVQPILCGPPSTETSFRPETSAGNRFAVAS